jgi:hypothetical protein
MEREQEILERSMNRMVLRKSLTSVKSWMSVKSDLNWMSDLAFLY